MKEKKIIISNKFFSNLFDKLFPINRSLLGEGYNESIKILSQYIGFKFLKFKSGTKVFDWVVPKEWIIKTAYILTPEKKKICDMKKNNLHVMNYSTPINKIKFNKLNKFLSFF